MDMMGILGIQNIANNLDAIVRYIVLEHRSRRITIARIEIRLSGNRGNPVCLRYELLMHANNSAFLYPLDLCFVADNVAFPSFILLSFNLSEQMNKIMRYLLLLVRFLLLSRQKQCPIGRSPSSRSRSRYLAISRSSRKLNPKSNQRARAQQRRSRCDRAAFVRLANGELFAIIACT